MPKKRAKKAPKKSAKEVLAETVAASKEARRRRMELAGVKPKSREDFNQAAFRALQETIKRSE